MIEPMPTQFDFYGLGKVEKLPTSSHSQPEAPIRQWLACKIVGDIQGIIALGIPPSDVELSVFEEILNILASQWATQQAQTHSLDIMIESPVTLSENRFQQIMNHNEGTIQSYVYQFNGHLLTTHMINIGKPNHDSALLVLS